MGSTWFLLLCFLLQASSSLSQNQENESAHKLSGINLNIYHITEHEYYFTPNSPSLYFYDVLANDQERVKILHSRLENKEANNTHDPSSSSSSSFHFHKQEVESKAIPLRPGISLHAGNYYVKIGLGSPVKYYAMFLDTGSSLSWLQCQPCKAYCHNQVDPLFNPSSSKTYKSLLCGTSLCSSVKSSTLNDPSCEATSNTCIYTASYGDSSYSRGYLSQDLLTLSPSQILPHFVFGCGQDNQGLFGLAAGLLGLAHDKLSMIAQLSYKYGYAFSYCLPTAFPVNPRGGRGFFSIGYTSLVTQKAFKFTPLVINPKIPGLYFLRLTTISVANKPLGVAAAYYRVPTIIDSGTVISRLPKPVYTALRDAFLKSMSNKYPKAAGNSLLDTCYKGSLSSMSMVPSIQLVFQGGADLGLGVHNTLIEADKGIVCLAFAPSSDTIAIIGNHQQQTFKVVYDISKSKVGFAPGGCI